jgi:Uri superfamily endonuclease
MVGGTHGPLFGKKRHPLNKSIPVLAEGVSAPHPAGRPTVVKDMKRETPNPFGRKDTFKMAANRHGTYALMFKCSAPFQAVVGKLGPVFLSSGYWIYVGSAFGPGGLRSRLSHHLKPSHRPHWHLDYIKSAFHPVEIWATTEKIKREHDWAAIISTFNGASQPIEGFGATDCACRSHLIHLPRRPGFFRFKKQTRSVIPAQGPLFRYDLEQEPHHQSQQIKKRKHSDVLSATDSRCMIGAQR